MQILLPDSRPMGLPLGLVSDVLYQIILTSDLETVLQLCLLNTATYETIKLLEPHICSHFLRVHQGDSFDPIITLDPWSGTQYPLSIHSLARFVQRRDIAHQIASNVVPSLWGPFTVDRSAEMDYTAELRLASRLERGLHVLFHMGDLARFRRKPSSSVIAGRLLVLTNMLEEYRDQPEQKKLTSLHEHTSHAYGVVKWGYREADTGTRRLEFRSALDDQTQIDFHAALRMLRELMERMLLRHGPKDWHRDAKNEYSVISWFLMSQSPVSLAKLFLGPQDACCHLDRKNENADYVSGRCHFADPLDTYWTAWKSVPELGCIDCDCKRRARSWSVKPALVDDRGRDFNRAAERYLRDMWSQRHVGLHRALTSGYFNTVL